MAIIRTIKCDSCGYVLFQGTGTAVYVREPAGLLRLPGRKVYLPEPPVSRSPGTHDLETAINEGRLGSVSPYYCSACRKVFPLDSKSHKRCRKCGSREAIKSVFQMIGSRCTKCRKGIIKEKRIGIT